MPDLCETFRWQAGHVWNRMAKAASVRMALSEETITETALYEMALARFGDSTIAITLATKPQEARHGGDWEWWLIAGKIGISFRVQAKRLFRNGRYQSLLKPAPHPYAQLDILRTSARRDGHVPLYCFFNFDHPTASFTRSDGYCRHSYHMPSFWGCTLAFPDGVRAAGSDRLADLRHNGDIPWVSLADTGQLREVDFIEHTAVMTTADGIAHSSAHLLSPGTVVFSRDATIGLCAITRTEMAVSQHFIGWVCGPRLQPEYLLFVLRSMTQEMERLTMGATVRTIGMPDVRSLATPIPPISEQEQIIHYVYEHRSRVDSLINKIRGAIERLKELRTALVSAAVTGKIDVRGEIA
jgi:hypothetical protein